MRPAVSYARNGRTCIGYSTFGEGTEDLVYVAPFNHLDLMWENPLYAQFLRKLGSFARVTVVDRRGTGVSDRYSPEDLPPLEDLVDDLTAVLDQAGSERTALFGFSDAGALCAMFAATHPERVSGLVLYATAARGTQAHDYPWQWTEAEWSTYLSGIEERWGTREHAAEMVRFFTPSIVGDEALLAWFERFHRSAASPSAILAQEQVFRAMDIRSMLPAIGVPTLVLHREGDRIEPVEAGRYIAGEIAGARFAALAGADHFPWAGDQDPLVGETERFLRGVWSDERETFDRVLATIMFTDIVGSTAASASLGDAGWRAVSERHDRVTRAQLARFRGREVRWTGDGYLAVFDGPARAVRCAQSISQVLERSGVRIRAGLHAGEIEPNGDDIAGLAVAIGARVGALAEPGEVLVSSTVRDLVVGSGLQFADRGTHALKGVPGTWQLHALVTSSAVPSPAA